MTARYVLDAHGNPQPCDDLITWARWFETANRHVEHDDVGETRVSTVFLGLDHGFSGGPPMLWETLVLGGVLDGEQDYYTSKAAALLGHHAMCQRVRNAQRPA